MGGAGAAGFAEGAGVFESVPKQMRQEQFGQESVEGGHANVHKSLSLKKKRNKSID